MKWCFQIFVLLIPVLVSGQNKIYSVVNSEIVINYSDSTVKASIYLKNIKLNPKQNLVYYWYNSDKINRNMGGYSGRLLDGTYKVFDLNKNLVAEGNFKKGLKHGIWKRWSNKGGLLNLNEYKRGIKQGKELMYDRSGKIIFIDNYKNGFKNGKCIVFTKDTMEVHYYKQDIEVTKKKLFKRIFSKIFSKKKKIEKVKEENINENSNEVQANQNEVINEKNVKTEEEKSKNVNSTGNVKKKKRYNKLKNKKPTDEKKFEIND